MDTTKLTREEIEVCIEACQNYQDHDLSDWEDDKGNP